MLKVGHHLSDEEIERHYSKIAAELGMPGYFYPAVAAFAAAAIAARPEPRAEVRVLDLGCGNGDLLAELTRLQPAAAYIGAEIAGGRLRLAQQRLPLRTALLQIDGKAHLPLADASVELVLVTEVIEHLKQPAAFLDEIYRILTPSGRLILTTPNSAAFPGWPRVAAVAERFPRLPLIKHFLPYEHPLRTLQPIDTVLALDDVRRLLRQCRLQPVRSVGREVAPFIFSLPLIRRSEHRGLRRALDGLFNRAGLRRACYRTFWECSKQAAALPTAAPREAETGALALS